MRQMSFYLIEDKHLLSVKAYLPSNYKVLQDGDDIQVDLALSPGGDGTFLKQHKG